MSVAVATFVKTPGRSPIKTRLAADLGHELATTFFELSVKALGEVLGSEGVRSLAIQPYWAIAELGSTEYWSDFPCIFQGDGDLGDRLATVYGMLSKKHRAVILIGGDAPHLNVDLFRQIITDLATHDFVVGPARDGGFYVFAGKSPVPRTNWRSVQYSQQETWAQLQSVLQSLGSVATLPTKTDVDTIADLAALADEMAALPHLLPAQEEILAWVRSKIAN